MDDLKLVPNHSILFQCIGGSHAYGLAFADSDVDHRGVFIADKNDFLRGDYQDDVSNETNDDVLFEVGKFIRLLSKSNPSVIELISIPDDCIQGGSEWIRTIDHSKVLSKQCKETFAGYALSQIRKARKIKGMINKPNEDFEKSALDFLDVLGPEKIESFTPWHSVQKSGIGFRKVDRFVQIVETEVDHRLIDDEGELLFTNEKDKQVLAWASLRESEWNSYKKTYKTFWTWKKLQAAGQELQQDYNAKNVMHAFRLIYTGTELAKTGRLNIRRENERKFLLEIRQNKFSYTDLVVKLEKALGEMDQAFAASSLPLAPDSTYLNEFLSATRKRCYSFE